MRVPTRAARPYGSRMERFNRRQQGDLGEASAIEWFTRAGAVVSTPLGHSPDYDLIADLGNQILRVQAKASAQLSKTPNGHVRFPVQIATNGGNQSWTGQCKRFDSERFDYLFALTRNGRRWLVPSHAVESGNVITLGGPKYGEFEIDATGPIGHIVYSDHEALLDSTVATEEYPSGQRMATVNRPAQPSQVRILPPPLHSDRPTYQRQLGRSGQAVILSQASLDASPQSIRGRRARGGRSSSGPLLGAWSDSH